MPKFVTKLSKILHSNNIRQTALHEEIVYNFDPPVQLYQISLITSGRKKNASIKTYQKILFAINSLTKKKYKLSDIVDPDVSDEDLIIDEEETLEN